MTTNLGNGIIKFGGVSLNASEVKSKTIKAGRYGTKYYIVDFKNGTKVAYTASNNGTIFSNQLKSPEGFYNENDNLKRSTENRTSINNVKNVEVIGTKDLDYIDIHNSTITSIDTSGDKGYDCISIKNSQGSLGQRVLIDKNTADMGNIDIDSHDEVNIDNKSKRIYKNHR